MTKNYYFESTSAFFKAFAQSVEQAAKSRAKVLHEKYQLFSKSPATSKEMELFLEENKRVNRKESLLSAKIMLAIQGGRKQLDQMFEKSRASSEIDETYRKQNTRIETLIDKTLTKIEKHLGRLKKRLQKEEKLISHELNLVERKKEFAAIKKIVKNEMVVEKEFASELQTILNKYIESAKKEEIRTARLKTLFNHGIQVITTGSSALFVLDRYNEGVFTFEVSQDYLFVGSMLLMGVISGLFLTALGKETGALQN